MVSIAGSTLLQIVTAVAQEIGPCQPFTTSATGGAANLVVAERFADTEAPIEKYGGFYLYSTVGNMIGEENRIKRGGFNGGTATFTTARNFTSTPTNPSQFLLLGTMPILDQDGLVGIRTCVNRAIRKLWIIDKIDIAATSGVYEYDLAAYPWMAKQRVKRLLDPDPGASGHQVPASQGWQVVQNADLWTLELGSGYATGQTFSLVVERPANSRLYLNGAWADQASPTAGLALGADACLGEFEHVFQCSLYETMKQLALQAGGSRKSYWQQRTAEQRVVVSAIKLYEVESVEQSLGDGQEEAPSSLGLDASKGLFSGRWG